MAVSDLKQKTQVQHIEKIVSVDKIWFIYFRKSFSRCWWFVFDLVVLHCYW